MFLEKYLKPFDFEIIYDNYEEFYINSLDEENFKRIYNLLKEKGFYFLEDIICNYLELFEMEEEYVKKAIDEISLVLGEDYVFKIGKNMLILDKIIERAYTHQEEQESL